MIKSKGNFLPLYIFSKILKKSFVSAITLSVLVYFLFPVAVNAVYDPPHTKASGVTCDDCHGNSFEIAGGSPFWTDNKADAAYNAICRRCHLTEPNASETYGGESAPLVQSHAPGGTEIKCTMCHNNHEQEQIYPGRYNQTEFFIATGTKDVGEDLNGNGLLDPGEDTNGNSLLDPGEDINSNGELDPGEDFNNNGVLDVVNIEYVYSDPPANTLVSKSIIPYSDLSITNKSNGYWAKNLTDLAAKTGANRGAMLVSDTSVTSSRWPVYMIESIDPNARTITVKGEVTSANKLGIFYGQLVRNIMRIDNQTRFVEFFDRKGTKSFTRNTPPYGICQVCHENKGANTGVAYWRNDGTGQDHNPGADCMGCHSHTGGFIHGDGSGGPCIDCHISDNDHDHRLASSFCGECHAVGTQDEIDLQHDPLGECAPCHGYSGSKLNPDTVAAVIFDGKDGLDQKCEDCHIDSGHDTTTAHDNRIIIDMVPDCSQCHAIADHLEVDKLHTSCATCHAYQGGKLSQVLVSNVVDAGMAGTEQNCQSCHEIDHAAYATDTDHDNRNRITSGLRFDCSSAGCHIVTDQPSIDTLHTICDTCHFYSGTKLDSTLVAQVISDGKGGGGMSQNCEACHTWEPHHGFALPNRPSCENCHLGNVVEEHVDRRGFVCDTCHASAIQAVTDAITDGKNDKVVSCNICHDDGTVSPGSYQAPHHATVYSRNGDCLYCHGVGRGVNGPRQASCSKCHAQGKLLDPQRPSINAHERGPAITNVQDYRACFSCHLEGNRGYDPDPDGLPIGDPAYSGTPVVTPYHAKRDLNTRPGQYIYDFPSNEEEALAVPGLGTFNLNVGRRWDYDRPPEFPLYWARIEHSGKRLSVPSLDGTGRGGQYTGAGNLTATIEPSAAIDKGAEWSVDGGVWLESGSVLNGLTPRQYMVEAKKVLDWASPSIQSVDITDGNIENITLTYLPCPADPSLTISGTSSDGATITWDSATHKETFQVQAGDFRNGDIQWVLTTGGAEGFALVPTGSESVSLEKNGETAAASYSFILQATGSNCPDNEATINFTVNVTGDGILSPDVPSTGMIGNQVIDSYVYKLDTGQSEGPDFNTRPRIFHVEGDIYGLLHIEEYDHYPNEVELQTFRILSNGNINHIETYRVAGSAYCYNPTAVKVSDGVFAIAFTYYGRPNIETLHITSAGAIESIKYQSFSPYSGDSHPYEQSQFKELGGGYFLFTNDKFMFTVQIDATGETITEVDSRSGYHGFLNNEGVLHVKDDIYVYYNGHLNTINISATGDISDDPIDSISTLGSTVTWLRHVENNLYLAAGNGFLGTFEIQDNGQIAMKHFAGFKFENIIGNLLQVGPNVFAVTNKFGALKTFQVMADGVISLEPIDVLYGLGEGGIPDLFQVSGNDPVLNDQVYVFGSDGENNGGLKTVCIYDPETDDLDNDGFCDQADTCPDDPGIDADSDGLCGDADLCPGDATNDTLDNDTICGGSGYDTSTMAGDNDNCPTVANGPGEAGIENVGNQLDTDSDGAGDACDNCMGLYNPDQVDIDCDGEGDACDAVIGNAVVGPQCYFSTIQTAIDASADGDTVMVKEGTYVENINFKGKDIILRSEKGPDTTIIDGSSLGSAVVTYRTYESQDCVLDGFTIENGNSVGRGGGGIYIYNASPTITNCIIRNNSSTTNGGGIYVVDKYSGGDSINISNTVIENNTADDSDGGGIYMYKTDVVLTGSTVRNNSANGGGGIHQGLGADLHVINSYITGNTATETGGGVDLLMPSSIEYEYLYILNSTIADNTAVDGGGFYIDHEGYGSQFRMVNSIVWGNTNDSGVNSMAGGGIATFYSDVQGSGGSVPNANIDADPLFEGAGDYHLTSTSPCIDTGTNDVSFLPLFPDLPADDPDGDSRPICPAYDMGADEHSNPDDDGDGVCNSVDICLTGDDAVDTDSDGVPDACDLCPGEIDSANDLDGDGLNDICDPCPDDNPDDIDGDGVCTGSNYNSPMTGGNDPCPIDEFDDSDGDGLCDSDDPCPADNPNGPDNDGDGIPDVCDLCPAENPNDSDGDGVCASNDNCPEWPNADQADCDNDTIGDVCDPVSHCTTDRDGDGVLDGSDNCIMTINPDQADTNFDGMGDTCTLYHFINTQLAATNSAGEPKISNSRYVVWHARNSSSEDYEIYLHDGNTGVTTQLTDNTVNDLYPQVNYYGDVVWQGHDGTRDQIYFYDHLDSSTTQISETAIGGLAPKMNDSRDVVWVANDGNDDEIYMYDHRYLSGVIQISDNNNVDKEPQINEYGDVVWTNMDQHEGIYYYTCRSCTLPDGGSINEIVSNHSFNYVDSSEPYLNFSRDVVFLADYQVSFYDASEDSLDWYVTTSGNGGNKSFHDINNNSNLIWTNYYGGMYFYNTSTGVETLVASAGIIPRLNDNDDIIWSETGGRFGAYYYNKELDRTFKYSNAWAEYPDLNNRGDVAWKTSQKIYLALFGIDPDTDADGVSDTLDNCPATENSFQIDSDSDGLGDACDNCPADNSSTDQTDCDNDGIGDICDLDSPCSTDTDGDTVFDDTDNCIAISNIDQADCDDPDDGVGDVCETNSDNDGIPDDCDNCPANDNISQSDIDVDGIGDACDPDIDNDGVANGSDNCPYVQNPGQEDIVDGDGIGDACDTCPTGLTCFDWPDTGQTTCSDGSGTPIIPCPDPENPLAQDGSYQRNPPSYTDNPDTITDNNTGLTWQKGDGGMMDPWSAVTYCSDLDLASKDDWRLPNTIELATLLDYDFDATPASPAIDLNYFPSTSPDYYHTNVPEWRVHFGGGWTDGWGPGPGYARCVRGDEIVLGDFTDNGDQTLTDNTTGLIWQKAAGTSGSGTWEAALGYCEGLVLGAGGEDDWRLPNIREMMTIIDVTVMFPPKINIAFDISYGPMYWSSTSGLEGAGYVEIIDLSDGSMRSGPGSLKTGSDFGTVCVRNDQ